MTVNMSGILWHAEKQREAKQSSKLLVIACKSLVKRIALPSTVPQLLSLHACLAGCTHAEHTQSRVAGKLGG